MTGILTDLSPSSLAMAIKANLYAFFQSFRNSSKARFHDSAHGYQWHTSVAHPWFNGVLCTQPPAEEATQAIRDTLSYFQSLGVASFTWWLAPHLEPTAWSQHLLPQGFHYDDHTPGMAMHLAALPPAVHHPLAIRQVEDGEMLAVWARTFIRGYEIPEAMTTAFGELIQSLGTDLP